MTRPGHALITSCGERRAAPRYDARTLAVPIGCRVNPGHEVQLTNVSAVGARIESGFALLPGRALQLHLHLQIPQPSGPGARESGGAIRSRRAAIETRVAWCVVTAVLPGRGVRFAAGLAFARWVDLATELAMRVRPLPAAGSSAGHHA